LTGTQKLDQNRFFVPVHTVLSSSRRRQPEHDSRAVTNDSRGHGTYTSGYKLGSEPKRNLITETRRGYQELERSLTCERLQAVKYILKPLRHRRHKSGYKEHENVAPALTQVLRIIRKRHSRAEGAGCCVREAVQGDTGDIVSVSLKQAGAQLHQLPPPRVPGRTGTKGV